jgi:arsenate reductase
MQCPPVPWPERRGARVDSMFRLPTTVRALAPALLLGCMACRSGGTSAPPEPVPATTTSPTEATEGAPSMADEHGLHPALKTYLDARMAELDALPPDRRETLGQLASFVREQHAAGQPARLLFICTHNSRRSHMGQLWAAAAAAYFEADGIETYSGGTEATAFNPRAVAAMERAGFVIARPPVDEDNPRYEVSIADGVPAMVAYSKTWQDPANPREGFAAVMTCSQADEACPFVQGAVLRVSLPYEDPKLADGTAQEAERYDQRARQIATEMLYLFRLVAEDERGE